MLKSAVTLFIGILVAVGGAAPAEACWVPSKIKILWPTLTSTAVPANTRVLLLSRINEGGDVAVRLQVRSLSSTTTAIIPVSRLDSKYLATAHPYADIEALWLADTDLSGFDAEVEVSAESFFEGGTSATSTSARVVVVPAGPDPASATMTENGAYFFRDPTFDEPFDTCSFVHANEGTLLYLHVQSELPAALTVIPDYPCESSLSDPAYTLSAHGSVDLRFSFFSRDCGQPSFRYEMVDVLGRQSSGPLNEIEACAPTLLAARWGLSEWQSNGQACTEALFDAGISEAGTLDAGADAGAADTANPLSEQGCACTHTMAPSQAPGWAWFAILPLLALRRRHEHVGRAQRREPGRLPPACRSSPCDVGTST